MSTGRNRPETGKNNPRDVARGFDSRLRLARATELAHSNRFLEAVELLSPKGKLPSDPNELDILARIHLRQKDFNAARRRWLDASSANPDSPIYRQAIDALDSWLEYRHKLTLWKLKLLLWFLVVSIAMILFISLG